MFSKLASFLDTTLSDNDSGQQRDVAVHTATAALLIEVARGDFDISGPEMETVERVLRSHFDISEDEVKSLMEAARTESDQSASLYRFTHAVHEHLTREEKRRVIQMLWEVAMADDQLDKYEDHVMHKIARLIYVPNGELMAIKSHVLEKAS